MPLKVSNAILCDHVRVEDNGKHILIGVYAGDIVLHSFPGAFAPTFWLQFATEAANEELDLELRIDGPDGVNPTTAKLMARSGEDRGALVIANAGPFLYQAPGKITCQVRQKGGRWMPVLSKGVIRASSTPPSS